jgi:hypothetical protein
MHALGRPWLAKIPAQLVQKSWEVVARIVQRSAESPRRIRITSGGAAEAQVDPSGKERFERAELFGNGKGRMIWQHDTPGTHTDCRSRMGDVTDQNRSRRACHPWNIVMFGQPKSPVAQ